MVVEPHIGPSELAAHPEPFSRVVCFSAESGICCPQLGRLEGECQSEALAKIGGIAEQIRLRTWAAEAGMAGAIYWASVQPTASGEPGQRKAYKAYAKAADT